MVLKNEEFESSFLASVAYNTDAETLDIELQSGKRFRYYSVSRKRFSLLVNSHSKGSYYSNHIRGRYPMRRLKTAA